MNRNEEDRNLEENLIYENVKRFLEFNPIDNLQHPPSDAVIEKWTELGHLNLKELT